MDSQLEGARPAQPDRIYRTLIDRDDITDRLGEITVPALVIHGEEDAAIDETLARRLFEGLPGALSLVRVPGAGHASNMTHPELVNSSIEAFLTHPPVNAGPAHHR